MKNNCRRNQLKSRNPGIIYKRLELGYSMIELLFVLLLLGLVTAIAYPVVSSGNDKRQLEIAANTMAMDMRKMQQKAVTTGSTQFMEFRIAVNDYRIRDSRDETKSTTKLLEKITYRSVTFPSTDGWYRQLSFNRTGAPNRGGTVGLVNDQGELLYIIVTPATGRVRVSESPPDN